MARMTGLDLFSGLGGIGEGLSPWVRTVAYCEIEPYARATLFSRMKRGEIDPAPVHVDVSRLGKESLKEIGVHDLDIVFGGFPCTDISLAGQRAGMKGKDTKGKNTRSGLFYQITRIADEMKPKYIMLENVAAIRSMAIDQVMEELHSQGYDARYGILSAYDVGACHKRERWWLLARRRDAKYIKETTDKPDPNGDDLFGVVNEWMDGSWEVGIPRLTDIKEHRANRLRLLGNSVVPQAVREVILRLTGMGGMYGVE